MTLDIILIISGILSIVVAIVTIFVKMGKYQQKVDDLRENQERIFSKIDTLRTDTDIFKEFKVHVQKFIDQKLYSANSPLQLTELGQKLINESGFSDIFEQVKDDLVRKLQDKNPMTQYDIQEEARELMDSLTDYQPFAPIKIYAFEKGQDFRQILRAGAILLRDYYFSIHKEIKK